MKTGWKKGRPRRAWIPRPPYNNVIMFDLINLNRFSSSQKESLTLENTIWWVKELLEASPNLGAKKNFELPQKKYVIFQLI